MPVVRRILVTFDQDSVAARDEESCGRVAGEVVIKAECLALILLANCGFLRRPLQRRRSRGTAKQPTLIDLVEMAVAADEKRWARAGCAIADRITLARAVLLRIRAACGEAGVRPC